jgi:methionine-rich copper-binding protein CopC
VLRVLGILSVCLGVLVTQVLLGAPARAHSYLVSSTPPDGTVLSTAPAEVALTFDEPVSTRFSEVRVVGPDGGDVRAGAPRVSGATVTQPLGALGAAGGYEVSWRVVSADGHPISGTFTFTLATAGTGGPATAPGRATGTVAGPSWLVPAGVLAGAALLLAGGSAVLARRQRGRGASGDG